MAKDIVQYTKVTINNQEHICKKFTEIWELFGWGNSEEEENAKINVLRALLVNGKIELPTNGKPVELEIVPIE